MTEHDLDGLLARVEAGEIWGIGRRNTARLQEMGIVTVLDLKCTAPKWIRDEFSVVMERTVAELNGVACLELKQPPWQRQDRLKPTARTVAQQQAATVHLCNVARNTQAQAGATGIAAA